MPSSNRCTAANVPSNAGVDAQIDSIVRRGRIVERRAERVQRRDVGGHAEGRHVIVHRAQVGDERLGLGHQHDQRRASHPADRSPGAADPAVGSYAPARSSGSEDDS